MQQRAPRLVGTFVHRGTSPSFQSLKHLAKRVRIPEGQRAWVTELMSMPTPLSATQKPALRSPARPQVLLLYPCSNQRGHTTNPALYSRIWFSPSPRCCDLAQSAFAPLLADRTASTLFCRMNPKRICLSIWLARRSMIKSYVAHYRGKSKWEQCLLTIFRNNYLLIASCDLS